MIHPKHIVWLVSAMTTAVPLILYISNRAKSAPIKYRIKREYDDEWYLVKYRVQHKTWPWPFWRMPMWNYHHDQHEAYLWLNRYLKHEPPHKKIIYLDEKGGI